MSDPFCPVPTASPDAATIAALKAGLRRLGGAGSGCGPDCGHGGALPFGIAALDAALPWGGLPRAALHEIVATGPDAAAAMGLAAVLAARLAGPAGTVIWCRRTHGLYGPGLAAFGLAAERLIVVRAPRRNDMLWTLEEALRSGAPAAVVGEPENAPPTALRRLQLAAETHGVPALLLRPAAASNASPATTRWRVAAMAGRRTGCGPRLSWRRGGLPSAIWRLTLERCRGRAAAPEDWIVEWCDATGDLVVAADVRHRSADAAPDTTAATAAGTAAAG